MKLQKLTRKQIRERLDTVPLDRILGVPKRNLTNKQQKFCEYVAQGETGAEAYRMAYGRDGAKAKPKVAGNRASKLKESEVIQREIEAIRTAIEFEKSHTTAQLRALVVSQLTKEALDPENNANARLVALRALGTVAGVDAFQHITQSTIIKDSSESRAELMEKLKQAIADNMRTVDSTQDDDADRLLSLIQGETAQPIAISPSADPTAAPPDLSGILADGNTHTIPDTQSP